jgi:hypothetical protein
MAWLAPGSGALTIGDEEGVGELRLQPVSATEAVDRIATKNALDTRRITPPAKLLFVPEFPAVSVGS